MKERLGEQWDAGADPTVDGAHSVRRHYELALRLVSVMRTDGGENERPSWSAEPVGMLEMRRTLCVSR